MVSRAAFSIGIGMEPPMRRMPAKLVFCLLLAAVGCKKEQAGGSAGAGNGPIKIGEVGSMTGNEATFGTSSDRGIQLATGETTAAGGITARQIHIIPPPPHANPNAPAPPP